jgi:hypothetical protein
MNKSARENLAMAEVPSSIDAENPSRDAFCTIPAQSLGVVRSRQHLSIGEEVMWSRFEMWE